MMLKKPPIRLTGVKQNNLKGFTVEIPHRKMTVVTGVSGSGKSSLAFDTLYAEGQRRYIESLSTYTRQFLEKMPKPDVDLVENIPPSIALEQRNHVINSRSTVGTQTEIIDYLRVLFARVGKTFCIKCGGAVQKIDAQHVHAVLLEKPKGKRAILAPFQPPEGKKKGAQQRTLLYLREQGFRRLLWVKNKTHEFLDLDEIESPSFAMPKEQDFAKGCIYIVVDRLIFPATVDTEFRTRLMDSIEQAVALGRGKVSVIDLEKHKIETFDCQFACIKCGERARTPEPQLFSFNNPLGACVRCSGFGFTLDLDEARVVPDPTKTLKNGALDPFSKPSFSEWEKDLFRFAERHGISIGKRYQQLTDSQKKLLWHGDPKDKTFPGVIGCFEQLARYKYKLHVRVFIRRYQTQTLCPECRGQRLNPSALAVKIGDHSIADILNMTVLESLEWVRSVPWTQTEKKISADILQQVEKTLHYLEAVGVGYLTLSRLAKTLSGGEFQRINLATQLGTGLCGTLYVLDEPSIGLHAADTKRLMGVLHALRDQGNTLVVVEHDLEVMRAADWLIELGPGAGRRGGEKTGEGTASQLSKTPGSLTGKYLNQDFELSRALPPRPPARRALKITDCEENNLKKVSVEFPLERLVVVTGVSGSGKSTLVHQTLYRALENLFTPGQSKGAYAAGKYGKLYGADFFRGVTLLDQKPIGRTSRSNPATYLKAWDEVRRVYANQVMSLRRGYTPQYFSFNVEGGRCPTCRGEGTITLDMHFLAEIQIPCEECGGKRFKKNILEISYRGKNIDQLLNTTIDEAFDIFRDNPTLARKLSLLRDVGLGYLQLGQSATTLSGGESQRLKIAHSLDQQNTSYWLYIFDEPTTGLHQEDVKKLMGVIQDLVSANNSVIMIEHHMDVIAQADWVIDLGPGGGQDGGHVVASGAPRDIARNDSSITGRMLREMNYKFKEIEKPLHL